MCTPLSALQSTPRVYLTTLCTRRYAQGAGTGISRDAELREINAQEESTRARPPSMRRSIRENSANARPDPTKVYIPAIRL